MRIAVPVRPEFDVGGVQHRFQNVVLGKRNRYSRHASAVLPSPNGSQARPTLGAKLCLDAVVQVVALERQSGVAEQRLDRIVVDQLAAG